MPGVVKEETSSQAELNEGSKVDKDTTGSQVSLKSAKSKSEKDPMGSTVSLKSTSEKSKISAARVLI